MYKYKLTIFTPTYNRGYIIENLYRSLQRQTFKNFEWLVIDDGSTDNTKDLFYYWTREYNFFPIKYIKVPNGGKHRAINKATEIAMGELFFIVDSDDYLTDRSLEIICSWENTIRNKQDFAGVSGNKGNNVNSIIGRTFNGDFIDALTTERNKFNIVGDKAEVYYTDILKRYKFPEFEGENFITERVVWDRIGNDGYKIRWFNEIIYIAEYLDDGLSKSGDSIFIKNPRGTAYNLTQMMKIYNYSIKDRISSYNAYYQMVKENVDMKDIAKYLNIKLLLLKSSVIIIKLKNMFTYRKVGV